MDASVDQNDKDNDDDSFDAGMPAADQESLESLIAKMSDFVQRCAPADEAKALNEQLWSMQMQVKLLAANAGGSGAHGSRVAPRRMSRDKKKKKKQPEAAAMRAEPYAHPPTRCPTRALTRALTRARVYTRPWTRWRPSSWASSLRGSCLHLRRGLA